MNYSPKFETKNTNKIDFETGQILNFYKPVGKSSFYIVKVVRAVTGVKKVGHAGTLDPFAEGVLLVCTGKATKQMSQLMDLRKEYVGVIRLGEIRDTDDITGQIISTHDVPELLPDRVRMVAKSFIGESEQIPPMYSARRVNGQRLYKLARKGVVVERKPRSIHIDEFDVLKIDLPFITIRVVCSKGTYIRVIARDFGNLLGCGAYLHSLSRTKIGEYSVNDALRIENFKQWIESN
ncbi:tRNA pseudouridine(55) synthase TruB [candidate division KSB1 bacterium]|nr:tRNA pseudouridine(55) synthase TruB [candidate division KSB1 bacterium]